MNSPTCEPSVSTKIQSSNMFGSISDTSSPIFNGDLAGTNSSFGRFIS